MKLRYLILPILFTGTLFLSSCANEEDEEEEDPYADRHSDFFPREDFYIRDGFKYYASNKEGYEGIERNKEEMDDHKPIVIVEEEGAKVRISFPHHPHKHNHYWAWVEIIDKNGTEFYEEINEPSKDVKDFEYVAVPEKPFRHRIRVRAFCHVHGEFQDYIDLPDYKGKSLIDR